MKKGFLCGTAASAIILALAGPGVAADLPVKAPPAFAPPVLYNWSGFYFGGHAGWGRSRFNGTWFGDTDTTVFPSERLKGGLGGVQVGYNYQVNNTFVLGLEGDVSFLSWGSSTFSSPTDSGGDNLSGKLNRLASLRGRLGIAFDRALLYATGGVGYAHGKFHAASEGGPAISDDGFSKWGGVAGGGLEYAFTNNLIGRVEGLYYFFKDNKTYVFSDDSAFVGIKDAAVIRVGLSYKFGPWGP
jgi:outer membrane immunogenic protein